MSRVPIRVKVTLAFAAVMAVVLVAIGSFLYLRLGSDLDENIDTSLRARAGEVSALVDAAGGGLASADDPVLIEQDESLAQVLTADGRVLDSTQQLGGQAVLSGIQIASARAGPKFFDVDELPGLEARARLLAVPVETDDGLVIAVVGSSLDDRDEAVARLLTLLMIGGPAALLIASLAGYWVAGTALRPVDAMRRRASEISASAPGERLPVPPADDELRRLGETLNEMLARLATALERERRFVDDASHELRTPLALHKTELELALRHGGGAAELRAAISSSIEEVDRLIGLSEALLVVARGGEEGLELNRTRIDVAALLDDLAERFRARAAALGREIRVGAEPGLTVFADRLRLEQALTGLVDNSLRHGAGEVLLSATGTPEAVEFHVADHGPGFGGGFVEHAFERFSRDDAARTGGGFGLGLAIVETIAKAHGGRARAANASAGGADVSIELPAQPSGG